MFSGNHYDALTVGNDITQEQLADAECFRVFVAECIAAADAADLAASAADAPPLTLRADAEEFVPSAAALAAAAAAQTQAAAAARAAAAAEEAEAEAVAAALAAAAGTVDEEREWQRKSTRKGRTPAKFLPEETAPPALPAPPRVVVKRPVAAIKAPVGGTFAGLAALGGIEIPAAVPSAGSPPKKRTRKSKPAAAAKAPAPGAAAARQPAALRQALARANARLLREIRHGGPGAAQRASGGGGDGGGSSSDDESGSDSGGSSAARVRSARRKLRTAQNKTVNMGLFKACKVPAHARLLAQLAVCVSEIQFDAMLILYIFAAMFVMEYNACHGEDGTPSVDAEAMDRFYKRFFENENMRRKGELFSESSVERAFSLAWTSKRRKDEQFQAALKEASEMYYNCNALRGVREVRPTCTLLDSPVLKAQAKKVRVSIDNLLNCQAWQAQRRAFKLLYNLNAKEAKHVLDRMGIAASEKVHKAVELAARAARAAAYEARRDMDAASSAASANPKDEAAATHKAEKVAKFAAAEAKVSTWDKPTATMKADAEAALDSKAWPPRKPRRNARGDEEADVLTPLKEVYEEENVRLPATKAQDQQLLQRASWAERLLDADLKRRFELMPVGDFTRKNVSVQRPTLKRLLNEPCDLKVAGKTIAIDGDTFQHLLPDVINRKSLRRACNGWDGYGSSLTTDGCTLGLLVCNDASLAAQGNKKKAMAGGKKKKAATLAAGQVWVPVGRPKSAGIAKKPRHKLQPRPQQRVPKLPADAVRTAADFGQHNLGGFQREGYDANAKHVKGQPRGAKGRVKPTKDAPGGVWTITAAEVRHRTGQRRRAARLQRDMRAWRSKHPAFRAALASLKGLPLDFSLPAVLAMAQTRGAAYRHLAPIYGR